MSGPGSGCELLRALGLEAELEIANDPFFGRRGRMLAANQRDQALKFEIVVPIAGPEPTALASFNHHRDHFGSTYGIKLADGGPLIPPVWDSVTSASSWRCCGTHGLDPDGWPSHVRAQLWGDEHAGASACQPDAAAIRRATRPHPLHAPERAYPRDQLLHRHRRSSCCTRCGREPLAVLGPPGADGLRGRPVDVLQASAGGSGAAVRGRHPRDAALPAVARADRRTDRARPDDHRRARHVVSSRHGGDELSQRARQDLSGGRLRSTPRASACIISTAPGLHDLQGEDYRGGVPTRRRLPTQPFRPIPSSCVWTPAPA